MASLDRRRPPKVSVESARSGAIPEDSLAGGGGTVLQTQVVFHTTNSQVQFGETLAVVGSHPALGDWNPDQGLVLTTSEEIFPCWVSAEPVSLQSQRQIEYKYVVLGEDRQLRMWEEYTGNRTFLTSGVEMTIEDDEGLYRQFVAAPMEEDDDDDVDETSSVGLAGLSTRTPQMRKMLYEHKMAMVEDLEGSVRIETHDTVFMVGLALPVKIVRDGQGWRVEEKPPTDGRNFAWLPLLQEFRKKSKVTVKCVGWPGVHVDNFRERAEIEKLLAKHDCIPVFPPRKDFEKYINFCTTYLWPVIHDVMLFFQTSKPLAFNEHGWAAYQHVNNLYASAVVPHTHESDLIWIHDYHLLMTPTFISRKLVKANIGFYLHTPFPSSDSFKSLPIREELLSGLLCADQLGFQFFAYARNFLVSVKRIFGLDPIFKPGGLYGLEYCGRHVMLKVAHFPYPFLDTKQVVMSDQVASRAAEVKEIFKGKIVFASMDRCDNLSGLVPKFWAFKRFLRTHPDLKGKAVLVQYTFETAAGYDSTSTLLQALREQTDAFLQMDDNGKLKVTRAQGRGDEEDDIYLRVERVDRFDRLALFRAADVLLDTSAKAGLNLMPFEFITAQHDDGGKSVVIVSEFSGCSRVLLGSIRVNPWNTSGLVDACVRAAKMAEGERRELHECNLEYVSQISPFEWFKDFLMDLKRARKKEGIRIESIGFGAKIRHVCMTQNFQKLSSDAVLSAYRQAKNRVIFLDNEGTLASDARRLFREYGAPKGDVHDLKSEGQAPHESVLACLRALCQDQRNTVVVLSGRNQKKLEDWFGSVPKIGLAAERGFYYRLPLTGHQWHCMKQNPDDTWKENAFKIMTQFVKRTQGTFIECKGSALVWQYRDADQHYGGWQAKELSSLLKELLFGFDVDVMNGKGYVEVKLRGVNKGVAVSKVLSKVSQAFGEVDFVLCVGDDRSDEDMFEAVQSMFGSNEEAETDKTSSQLSTTDGESDGVDDVPAVASEVTGLMTLSEPGGLAPTQGLASKSMRSLRRTSLSGLSGLSGSFSRGDLRMMGADTGDDAAGSAAGSRRFFTCTVGRKPSAAKFYLDDVDEVSELLASLKAQHDKQLRDCPPSYHTWSGGDLKKGMRVGSMPALSSLAFGPGRRA